MKIYESKKATITVYGLLGIFGIVALVKAMAPDVDDETLMGLVTLLAGVIGSYNLGQGIADHGKERPPAQVFIDPGDRES